MGCNINVGGKRVSALYQDIWFKGKAIVKGSRECEFRYHAIYNFMKKFKRPVKVLDVGANLGYFSLRLSEKLPGTFVMVEGGKKVVPLLYKTCLLNNDPQLIFLYKILDLQALRQLAETEHFDVVLALSIIHHFHEPYNEVLKALTQLGTYLILEVPNAEEKKLCNKERVKSEPLNLAPYDPVKLIKTSTFQVESLKSTAKRTTYLIESPPKVLTRPYWQAEPAASGPKIQADYKSFQYFLPGSKEPIVAANGLNFCTFLALGGIYPRKARVIAMLQKIDLKGVKRLNPWDLIMYGDKICLAPTAWLNEGEERAGEDLIEIINLYRDFK